MQRARPGRPRGMILPRKWASVSHVRLEIFAERGFDGLDDRAAARLDWTTSLAGLEEDTPALDLLATGTEELEDAAAFPDTGSGQVSFADLLVRLPCERQADQRDVAEQRVTCGSPVSAPGVPSLARSAGSGAGPVSARPRSA